MKSWFKGKKHMIVDGVYDGVYKSRAPLGFSIQLRDLVFDGERIFGKGCATRALSRRRRKTHSMRIGVDEIVATPDTPFWRAFYKQLVAARVAGGRKDK
jgi:hypothetical protein